MYLVAIIFIYCIFALAICFSSIVYIENGGLITWLVGTKDEWIRRINMATNVHFVLALVAGYILIWH